MGILTEYHEKPIKSYLRRNADERRFYKRSGSLTSSIIVSMDMVREENQDVWWDIGERYGGPLTYSYSKFLVDHTDDSSLLLFAARDGYTLMRAVESLGLTNDSKYIYVQRLFSKVLHDEDVLKGRTIALPSRFSDSVGYKRTMMRLKTILSFFSRDLNLEKLDDGTSLEKAYNLNRGRIAALCRKARADYNHTLCELCGDRKIELVDCTTMRHSSQKLVEKTIGRGIHAHNLLILRDYDRGLSFDCLYQWPHTFIGWSRVDIPEFLLCSPELPVCGWSNGKPVFDDDAPSFEKDRAQHYPDVSDGELKYIERMTTIFSDHLPVFDYIDVNRWVLLSAAKGTRYRNLLKDIKWASGADHSDWAPIIPWDGMINRLKRISIDFLSKLNDD
jgi:predicted HAD superfamily hydrolase